MTTVLIIHNHLLLFILLNCAYELGLGQWCAQKRWGVGGYPKEHMRYLYQYLASLQISRKTKLYLQVYTLCLARLSVLSQGNHSAPIYI